MRWLFRLLTRRKPTESYLPLTAERLQMLIRDECTRGLVVLLVLLLPRVVSAQALPIDKLTPPASTQTGRTIADVASYGGVIAALAADTVAAWNAPDRPHAFKMEGLRLGVVVGVSEVVKRAVHRQRPCAPSCGIDNPNASFWSEHTAIAFSTTPHGAGGLALTFSLMGNSLTGADRVVAGKHFLTDVLAGGAFGFATSFIR